MVAFDFRHSGVEGSPPIHPASPLPNALPLTVICLISALFTSVGLLGTRTHPWLGLGLLTSRSVLEFSIWHPYCNSVLPLTELSCRNAVSLVPSTCVLSLF